MTEASKMSDALKLRSRMIASHQIPVNSVDSAEFKKQLLNSISKAPALFKQAPSILDFSPVTENIDENKVLEIVALCKEAGLIPFALTGDKSIHAPIAESIQLAWVDAKKSNSRKKQSSDIKETLVVNTPVRSGQQIYAKEQNLLVTNQVSAGAEVIADGNVHVFGPLRGRAIAGASGKEDAEIVCQQLEAELISIAGTYLVQDNFPEGKGIGRCRLSDDKLVIEYL